MFGSPVCAAPGGYISYWNTSLIETHSIRHSIIIKVRVGRRAYSVLIRDRLGRASYSLCHFFGLGITYSQFGYFCNLRDKQSNISTVRIR